MTERPRTPLCPHCGSPDIVSDAAARWSTDTQQWELSSTHDDTYCDDCGEEFNEPDWIDADRPDPAIHVFESWGHGYLARGWHVRHAGDTIGPLPSEDAAEAEHARVKAERDRLFNCFTDCMAPDWKLFGFFTIGGCKDDPDDPGHTLGLCDDEDAEFWTVYARYKEPDSGEAITDCKTKAEAEAVAAELSKLSGLPIGWPDAVTDIAVVDDAKAKTSFRVTLGCDVHFFKTLVIQAEDAQAAIAEAEAQVEGEFADGEFVEWERGDYTQRATEAESIALDDPDGAQCVCGNCGWQGGENALNPIKHFGQRVAPGEPCPAGECPDCGALAHLQTDPSPIPKTAHRHSHAPHARQGASH